MKQKLIPYTWEHSNLVYKRPRNDRASILIKESEFTFFENKMDFAYAAIYEDHVIFSFKGTDNIKGWISNMDPYPLNGDEYNKKFLKDGKWGHGTIHDGFYKSWSFFKSCITKIIDNYHVNPQEKQIITCGHSRGGALAELCSRHLAKNLSIDNSCFTFGAPAVGIKKYRDQFRSLPINGTRIVNGWDMVPLLPPKDLGFRHGCANELWVKKALWKKYIPWIRISDHYQKSYASLVRRKFSK